MSPTDPSPRVETRYQTLLSRAVIVSTFGGLLFGFDTGVINGALPYMRQPGQLSPTLLSRAMEGVIASSLLVGAAFGALCGGRLADRFGRRRTISILAIIFTVAAVGCATAPNVPAIVGFRILLGLGVGGASVTVPAYLAEIAPASRRGRIVTRNELMIVSGQFLAFVSNAVLANAFVARPGIWRWMLAMAVVPAIALWVGMSFMPESPRWFALRHRYEESLQVLCRIRPPGTARAEAAEIRRSVEAERLAAKSSWRELVTTPWLRRVLLIGILIAVVNQINGVNSIMYYGTQVISDSGLTLSASLIANIGNGLMSLIAMIVGIWLLGYVGRRRMVITGLVGTTSAHLAIGTVSLIMTDGRIKAYVVLSLTMAFLAFMQGAVGPATWVLLSEVFPTRVRGLGMGAAIFVMWTTNFVITLLFPWAVSTDGIGISRTFFVFAGLGCLAIATCIAWLPETKGKSLEQIEWTFADGRIPR
ncbi:MAG: sugar porter family MFS transporter [Bifidobacteriaceae bacterium]|jgi:major inositol transporter-like SP family MFS transporter|nr:sugar porter family MFS transporter [Bifidobacteriaceae bacterium]